MIADTSIALFNKMCLDGTVTKLDDRVYLAFKYGEIAVGGVLHPVRTRREAAMFLYDEASTVSGAVNRLVRQRRLIVDSQKTKCLITGNRVEALIWLR